MVVLSRFCFIPGSYICPALAANRPAHSNSVLRRNRLSSTVFSLGQNSHNECGSRCCSERRYMGKGHLNACATFTVLLKVRQLFLGPSSLLFCVWIGTPRPQGSQGLPMGVVCRCLPAQRLAGRSDACGGVLPVQISLTCCLPTSHAVLTVLSSPPPTSPVISLEFWGRMEW